MALKKFIRIKGWDALDTFYGREVKGVHIWVENFNRALCKCGETYAPDDSAISHKCPKCGNTDYIEHARDYYDYRIPTISKFVADDSLTPFEYRINQVQLKGSTEDDRATIRFEIEEVPYYVFKEDDVEDLSPHYSGYGYRGSTSTNDVNDLIKDWPHFKDFEEDLKAEHMNLSFSNIKLLCQKRNNYKNTTSDALYIQYPNVGKVVLNHVMSMEREGKKVTTNQKLECYLKLFGIDKSLLGVYDYYERHNTSSYRTIFDTASYGYWSGVRESLYQRIQRYKKEKTRGYQIAETYMRNGMVNLTDAIDLVESLDDIYSPNPEFKFADWNYKYRRNPKSFHMDDKILDMLPVYIKENISLKDPRQIVYEFIKDVETLQDLKIAVTDENLKVKNLNYYLNQHRLAEVYKLPADKVECFIDWFEKSPIKAIGLVENRRKMTKKQLDAFIDEISK